MRARVSIIASICLALLLASCGDDGQPAASTDGKLAFTSCITTDEEGGISCDIYVVNADGSGLTRAVEGGGYPTWAPNGSRLAFVGENGQLSIANADGSGLVRLADSGGISLQAWSPDSKRIVFVWGDSMRVINADGSGETELVENPEADSFFSPAWSPDGRRIAFVQYHRDTLLYSVRADGSGLTPLIDTEAFEPDPFFPTWSPDGARVAFAAEGDIYAVNADASGFTDLTSDSAFDNYPVWSPDSSRIAFSSCEFSDASGETCAVSVVNADGSGRTDVPAMANWPAWSPNGDRIAFPSCEEVDEETSTCAVYVVNVNGSGRTRVAEAPAGEFIFTLAWSPAP